MRRPKGIYGDYKPFRNWLRRLDQLQSLIDIWCYSQHVMEGRPLPADYGIGLPVLRFGPLKEHVYPWDLDVLTREIVLNAGSGGGHGLKNWADLATALDHIRRLEGIAFERGDEGPPDVLYELHRIAHRQFPWQIGVAVNPMTRAFKVFGQAAVDAIVVRELGMTVLQFLQLGMALRGHFQREWGMSTNKDYAVVGISRESSGAFLRRITRTVDQLKASKLRDPDTDYADDKAPDDAKWAQEAQRRQEVLAALQKRFPDAPARGWSASWTPGSSSGASRPSGSGAFCQNSS